MKWTLVRYKAKPDQAEENQRLSAAVFGELQQKAPAGLHYAVFRLPDDTFVHLASLEDGATPLSALETFRAFSSGVRERCLEPPELPQQPGAIVMRLGEVWPQRHCLVHAGQRFFQAAEISQRRVRSPARPECLRQC